MNRRSLRLTARFAGTIALASVLSGCGLLAGPSEAQVVADLIDRAAATNDSVVTAVRLAVTSRSTMSAEFRATADRAERDIDAFNESTDDLRSNVEISAAAKDFAQAANLTISLLGDGSIDVAAEVSSTQVGPKHTRLQSLLVARQDEVGEASTGPVWWLWALVGAVAVLVGYVVVQRRQPSLEELLARPNAVPQPEIHTEPGTKADRRKRPIPLDQRESHETPHISGRELPPPIGDDTPTSPPADEAEPPAAPTEDRSAPVDHAFELADPGRTASPIRNQDTVHSVRGGLRTVELRGIIDAALETMVDTGWEIAIECPTVSVLVDPLRMRRLLSNLLLSATAHGAAHIGLVAVIVDDRVEVNVGHDGNLLDGRPETIDSPPEVDHQLTVARQLLAGMHAEARWTNWRGVSLYTIELVRGPDEANDEPMHAAAVG